MYYISEYIFNGTMYKITETMETHNKLFTDSDYVNAYMLENLNNIEATAEEAQAPESEGQAPESEGQAPELEECGARDNNTFEWKKKNTHLLLDCYRKRLPEFRDPKYKKKELWKAIMKIFQNKGFYNVNVDILDRKMRNLKRTHKEIKDKNRQSGAGRISWEFYDIFENIFANDKTINFGPIIASGAPFHTEPSLASPLATPQYTDASNSIQDTHTHIQGVPLRSGQRDIS
ncbi:uncharacterized protein LOC143367050 [Andrena cerasifolii]|uniref:uncharacterized protein LOC143367050 n=1 Tax=Andrena cerasifolii TaxID=2819439 RepID=UPI0040376EC6